MVEELEHKMEDEVKELEHKMEDLEKAIEEAKGSVETLAAEIEALEDGIKALDKAVAEATEQRKEDHEDFVELMAADNAAKDIIGIAKNRLNKFYNPKLYKAPPKRELSEEERITLNMGGTLAPTAAPGGIAGTGIGLAQEAPPPPPEAVPAYQKKGQESAGRHCRHWRHAGAGGTSAPTRGCPSISEEGSGERRRDGHDGHAGGRLGQGDPGDG